MGANHKFRCRTHNSAANANSLQTTQFRQRITNFAAEHIIWQRMLIRYKQLSFGSESQIHCTTHLLAANANSLQTAQLRQRITNSLHNTQFGRMLIRCGQLNFSSKSQICCRQLNFGSESHIRCKTHNSTANANSLQTTQFRQRITNSVQITQLWQRITNLLQNTHFGNEC